MAFPFLSENGFEDGTDGHFDAESDSDAKLDFPHYSTLATIPGMPMPYRGAYCMRVDLSKGTADAYVQETGSWDLAADGSAHFRFMFWFGAPRGQTVTMADADLFSIFQLWSSTNTIEASIFVQYTTANGYRLGVNEAASASGASFLGLTLNEWHCIELFADIDDGVGNDGSLIMRLDGGAATTVSSLDQGAITSGVVGTIGIDAGTTRGVCLFDEIVADDARIFPPLERWPDELLMTASGHAFVGPGTIENITLMSGAGTDNVVSVFDTDTAYTSDASNIVTELKNTANNELVDPAGMPVNVIRGAYISMSGTNPRAMVKICRASTYGSEGAMRTYGANRTPVAYQG